VLRAFAELRDRGVELHFVRGNHDFWAGRFLEDALGFAIHDEVVLEQDGVRALLVHGDGLDPADRGYRVYKRVARAGLVVWLFRQLHPDWAMGLARAVSAGSRRANAPEHASLGSQVAPLRRFALERLAGEDVDAVLCGHSHYPAREEAAGGVYVNTGDWLEHRSYVVWSGGEFALKRFEAGPSV
jgi:UDP-2,3-diacylglucosamine hydrolase